MITTTEAVRSQVTAPTRGRELSGLTHAELVAMGGVYGSLYESWLGNTQVG